MDAAFGIAVTTTTLRHVLTRTVTAAEVGVELWAVTASRLEPPGRGAGGRLEAAVALDLHYLVTASGNGGVLEDQCALGQAALALASTPVLTSQVLRDAVTAHGSELAGWPDAAVVVGVDDRVAVTPEHLSVEELSRLRDVPGRRRVPSLTYVAEVVLT